MRDGRGERGRFARFGGRRRLSWRSGGGPHEERGPWQQPVGGLAPAAEIDDAVEEARIRADLVQVRRGSSADAATGEAGPSKRRKSTAAAAHSSPPKQLPSLANQAPARMDGGDGISEFMSAMGWSSFEGQPMSEVPMQLPNVVHLDGNTGQQGSGGNTSSGPSKQARKRVYVQKKNTNFTPHEDMLLVKSYLEVSNDPVVNTSQKMDKLWSRICKLYNEKRGTYPERTVRSAQSRWDVIKLNMGKFCGYYVEVMRGNHSGMTDADKTSLATTQFAEAEGHPFHFMHCWDIMKDEPKWMDMKHNKSPLPVQAYDGGDPVVQGSNSVPDANSPSPASDAGKRPLGHDASKAARKKAATGSSSSLESDFATNMQELVLSKNNLWDKELSRRAIRDEETMTLNREILQLEKEKVELQRINQEERILAIELDDVRNAKLRAYYKKMQDKIMNSL